MYSINENKIIKKYFKKMNKNSFVRARSSTTIPNKWRVFLANWCNRPRAASYKIKKKNIETKKIK